MNTPKQAVIYARASTQKQSSSIELQEVICRQFCEAGNLEVVSVFRETKSGASFERPGFDSAISECLKLDAVLVATKVDRLARRISVIGSLIDRGVRVRVVQLGYQDVNELMLGVFASLAQAERSLIRARTKEALRALKAKGVVLGNPNARRDIQNARQAHIAKSKRFNDKLLEVVADIRDTGVRSNAEVARCLNRRGFKSAQGKAFTGPNVARIVRAS